MKRTKPVNAAMENKHRTLDELMRKMSPSQIHRFRKYLKKKERESGIDVTYLKSLVYPEFYAGSIP